MKLNIKTSYIFKTNYFSRPNVWIKRILVIFYIVLVVIFLHLLYSSSDLLLEFLFILICSLFILFKPIDDLAIDKKFFYHLKISLAHPFTRIMKYEISKIKSVNFGGMYSTQFEIMELLAGMGFWNTIQITFLDNSSTTINVKIYKKEIGFIISIVNKLIKERQFK